MGRNVGVRNRLGPMTGDRIFRFSISCSSFLMIFILFAIFATLSYFSFPAIKKVGLSVLLRKTWNPQAGEFGILPFIVGTLLTSFLAISLTIPLSLSIALVLSEYLRDSKIAAFLKGGIELLAGIPSVVYGLWGLTYLVPVVREVAILLNKTPYGVGVLTSVLVLVVMIVPYFVSIATEVMALVPSDLKEAAYSLGATRYETIRHVILPYSKAGIIAGSILSFGRAMGETMAVTMLIGNSNHIPTDLFGPANTMASVIANEFQESTGITFSFLVLIGLVLLCITFLVNILGNAILKKTGIVREREVSCL